jgi:hypothetical protein
MDFRGRSSHNTGTPAASQASGGGTFNNNSQLSKLSKQPVGKLLQLGHVVLLFAVTALVVALTFLVVFGGNSQAQAIQKEKYQAVFLNNGQVYFGHIASLGEKSVDLRSIYYLQTSGTDTAASQTSSNNNVSLVKLGCELHAPYDQMMINKEQVIFWENLQDSSQVVKAIADYKKTNANQTCSQQSQSSTNQAPATTNPTTNPTTTTTPTPAATTPKKP